MDDLILHHYAGSPFAEKVRLMLGFKGLPWRSVTVPAVMPKPDLLALTGGYRRTPNLQIGADIYCDSALVARVLEARQPSPTLLPGGGTAGGHAGAVGRHGAVLDRDPVFHATRDAARAAGHAVARGHEGLRRRPRRLHRRHAPRVHA
jgi:glutathione S-transferase